MRPVLLFPFTGSFLFPPLMVALEHGEQRHVQRPSDHGVKALLPSGPLQQADDKRPAHLSPGDNHREQNCCSHWHLHWTSTSGMLHCNETQNEMTRLSKFSVSWVYKNKNQRM